jgi:hypothetical protein
MFVERTTTIWMPSIKVIFLTGFHGHNESIQPDMKYSANIDHKYASILRAT